MDNVFEEALGRYLSAEQLDKIASVKVGIAGAGGLGSNCALFLTRTGFKQFRIVDFDVVESSNLNRQFYFLHQIGKPKVLALCDNLSQINPNIQVDARVMKVEEENVNSLFADCDIVVEAFDRPEYKKLIVEAYMNSGKFLVSASGLAGWGDNDRITSKKIREKFHMIGDSVTQAEPGCPPLAPCVNIAAAKQADAVLTYVLGKRKVED